MLPSNPTNDRRTKNNGQTGMEVIASGSKATHQRQTPKHTQTCEQKSSSCASGKEQVAGLVVMMVCRGKRP